MHNLRKYRSLIIFVVIFAGIGVILLIISHAASPWAANEGESGTLGGSAVSKSDTNASGGTYVQFNPATVPTGNNAAVTAGFYPCDAHDKVGCFRSLASMLNRTPESLHVTLMTDTSGASVMAGNGWGYFVGDGSSANPFQWQNVNPHPNLTISVPLAFGSQSPSGATAISRLQHEASGADDGAYTQLVNYAKNAGYNNVTWRLGWEFDGDWMPWATKTSPSSGAAYAAAFRHVHDVIKNLMPNAKFDWCGDRGSAYANDTIWNAAYPGDSYVDIIGMDTYDFPGDTTAAQFNTNILPSLQYQENYAKAHHKQVSFPEWGLTTKDDPPFIQGMHDWFNSLPVTGDGSLNNHDYFNQTNSTLATAITDPQNPNSKALFIKLFSK